MARTYNNRAEPKKHDAKKVDRVSEYFNVWGRPGESEWGDVVKFYSLSPSESKEIRKRIGMGRK